MPSRIVVPFQRIADLQDEKLQRLQSNIANVLDPLVAILGERDNTSFLSDGLSDALHGIRGGGDLHADVVAAGDDGLMTGADKTIFDVTAQLNHGWNGSNMQDPVVVVSSDGAQWTLALTGPGTSDLGCLFGGVEFTLDATPAVSVNLTAGTDEVPQANFIYLTEAGGTVTLNNDTSGYPATAHIRIAECLLQSTASGATDGPYLNHQHSEHISTDDSGMIVHHSEKLRELGATWNSGVAAANLVVSSPDAYISVASGTVHQLHEHTFPAIDMQDPTTVYVVNDPTTPFKPITTLDDITQDASGGTINNRHFSLVVWGSQNAGDTGKLFINLPAGTYPTAAASARDVEKHAVFSIPSSFKGTGFLIAEYQVEGKDSGAWVQNALNDLRGQIPSTSPGGGPGVTDHGNLAGLADDDHSQYQLNSEKGAANGYASLDADALVPGDEGGVPTGFIIPAGIPAGATLLGYLYCDGAVVNITTFEALFDAIGLAHGESTKVGDVTTDFVTDDKIDLTTHGFVTDDVVYFRSTVTLPAGLTQDQKYFVINETANDFEVSETQGGGAVDITDDGTGTHSVYDEINIPDCRGQFIRGQDDGQAVDPDAAGRDPMATGGNTGDNVGSVQDHEISSHRHTVRVPGGSGSQQRVTHTGGIFKTTNPGDRIVGFFGGNETRPVNANVTFWIKT